MEELLAGLRAVGERTRLRILFLLTNGELTVKELTQILNQSQPRVSRHVKLMAEAGIIERYREGAWVFLRLVDDGPSGKVAKFIADMVPEDDEVVQSDMQRLGRIREHRTNRASLYFDQNAERWDKIRSLHVAEIKVEKAMQALVGEIQIEQLLDIGTGTGRVLELFAPHAERATGLDASHEMLAIARQRMEEADLRHAQVRHGDLYQLPLQAGTVDLVIIHQVLHFLDDPASALAEAARVLKPGGRLLVVDFAPHEQEFLREEQQHRYLGIKHEQIRRWSAGAGLEVTHHESLLPEADKTGGLTVSLWMMVRPISSNIHHLGARPTTGGE
ncbi:MAG: metalloregulator ArsR/SmtB family transcription factor [Alphaproteobacteria bacterium]|nr:metalloregulator ArsR/SmtB family transcription factor [Alphaproteobacteria bacterium]